MNPTIQHGATSARLRDAGVAHVFGERGLVEPFRVDALLGQASVRRVARARQVHGAVCVGEELTLAGEVEADAVWSEEPRVAAAVVTADCVPILAAGRDGARVVAIHAGWRGLLAGVVEAGLAALRADERDAGVGPCLCAEHFEVGPEVAQRFEAAGHGARVRGGAGDRSHVDLVAVVGDRLGAAGVEFDALGACTYCEPERWFSFRREVTHGGAERTGRLLSLIAPRTH